jgi:hypothetical protein
VLRPPGSAPTPRGIPSLGLGRRRLLAHCHSWRGLKDLPPQFTSGQRPGLSADGAGAPPAPSAHPCPAWPRASSQVKSREAGGRARRVRLGAASAAMPGGILCLRHAGTERRGPVLRPPRSLLFRWAYPSAFWRTDSLAHCPSPAQPCRAHHKLAHCNLGGVSKNCPRSSRTASDRV